MKILIITAIIAFNLITAGINAQETDQAEKKIFVNKLYPNFPDPFSEITLIEFNIEKENFVKVYITDTDGREIETLAEGEIEGGEHFVYFKVKSDDLEEKKYKCRMEIYSLENNSIIFFDESIMNQTINNKIVKAK